MVIPSSAHTARRLQAPSFQQSRRMPPCPCCIPRTRRRPRPSGYPDAPDASSSTPLRAPAAPTSCRPELAVVACHRRRPPLDTGHAVVGQEQQPVRAEVHLQRFSPPPSAPLKNSITAA